MFGKFKVVDVDVEGLFFEFKFLMYIKLILIF